MFVNTVSRKSIEKIRNEMKEIAAQKRAVENELRALRNQYNITDNNIRNRSASGATKVPAEVWTIREALSKKIVEYNDKLAELKRDFREAHIEQKTEENIALMGVFKEIFSDVQRQEIMTEIRRRRNGEPPFPLGLDFKELERYKEGYHKYRQLSKEQLEKMIEFRLLLTGLIEEGCKRFGDSEFMKFISPLNRLIIPVEELRKIKIKNLL